jgi:hypothetical protein
MTTPTNDSSSSTPNELPPQRPTAPSQWAAGVWATKDVHATAREMAAKDIAGPSRVIPVGQEPPRRGTENNTDIDVAKHLDSTLQASHGDTTAKRGPTSRPGRKRSGSPEIQNPEGFFKYRNRLQEQSIFTTETLKGLRRAEIAVWLAIHNCQVQGRARIGYARLMEITGLSKRHVGEAIRGLKSKGLIEVLFKGKYRPNGGDEHGLASIYRAYPRPEPRLVEVGPTSSRDAAQRRPGKPK